MSLRSRGLCRQLFLTACGIGIATVSALAQPVPSTSPSTAPATAPAAAKKPTVDQLLPKDAVTLNFKDVTLKEALDTIGEKYGISVRNVYDLVSRQDDPDAVGEPIRITLVNKSMTARQAIAMINGSLLLMGYTISENVTGDPPKVVLTVIQSGRRDTTGIQVYFGQDPAEIPEGPQMRTQVMTLTRVKASDAKEYLLAAMGLPADSDVISVNETARQLVITDTATHVRQAAGLLLVLERMAARETK
jgi:type II secretory pathway component GspD/PulD (secretin)